MKPVIAPVIILFLSLLTAVEGSAQIPETVKEIITQRVTSGTNPSIALAYFDQNGEHYFASGTANEQTGKQASENTLYRAGNLGNTLTALVTGRLAAKNEFSFQKAIGDLVYPPLPITDLKGDTVRIGNIMAYTSGIDDRRAYRISKKAQWDILYEDSLRVQLQPENTGTALNYSDWGMGLLSEGLGEYTRKGYPGLVKIHILQPLQLPFFYLKPNEIHAQLALPRPSSNEELLKTPQIEALQLYWTASVKSLLKYGKVFLDPPSGWSETVELLIKTRFESEEGIKTTLGWFKDDRENLYHAGHYRGYNTFLAIDRANQRVIALATNTSEADISDLGVFLLDPSRNPLESYLPEAIDNGALHSYAGVYVNEAMGLELELEVTQGELRSVQGEDTVSLHYMGHHSFFYEGQKAHLNFERDERDRVVGVRLFNNGKEVMLIKSK